MRRSHQSAGPHANIRAAAKGAAPRTRNGDASVPDQRNVSNTQERAANVAANGAAGDAEVRLKSAAKRDKRQPPASGDNPGCDSANATPKANDSSNIPEVKIRSDSISITNPHLLSVGQIAKLLVIYRIIKRPTIAPKALVVGLVIVIYPGIRAAISSHIVKIGHLYPMEMIAAASAVLAFSSLAVINRKLLRRREQRDDPETETGSRE